MSGDNNPSGSLKIPTTRFGELEVPQKSVITIVGGIIGFPNFTRYVMLDYNPPFSWLQSVDNSSLAFVVVNAGEFGENYTFSLPVGDTEIGLKEDTDVAIVNLVSVRPDPTMTTVNLKAPVVVNLENMRGRQIILDDPRYPTRLPLWSGEDEKK